MTTAWTRFAFTLALAFAGPVLLLGQVTSAIQGQVADASGAAVAGATVKATNEDTGVVRTASTAGDGYYRVSDLLAGRYQIRVEMPGFKTFVRSNLSLTAEAVLGLNMSLEVGEITESITVTAKEPLVETQVTRISEVIPEKEIKALPVQGRGILNLSILAPGIVGKPLPPGAYCCDVFSNFGAPRISAGGNEQKSQFLLDGITLREGEGSGYGVAFSPNPDAVSEVRVSADPYAADMGRMSGPQVQISTKGGTNEWHGTAHYTFQNAKLQARPFFSTTVPDSYYRLFGSTVGGPLIKDRLFAFAAYEGLRSRVVRSYRATVETEQFKDYVVRTRPGSTAAKLLQTLPPQRYPTEGLVDKGSVLPNGQVSSLPDGIPDLGVITVDSVAPRIGNQVNGRVDYHFPNLKDRLFSSYWYTKPKRGSTDSFTANPWSRPAYFLDTYSRINSANVVHTRAFTSNVLNEARFGLIDVFFERFYPRLDEIIHVPILNTDDGIGFPWTYENFYHSRTFQFADVLSINRGRHAVKIGANYYRLRTTNDGPNTPSYSFATILDFAADNPYQENRTLDAATGAADPRTNVPLSTGDFSIFIQNTWQIRPNLTLNYGLRWETFFPMWIQDRENFQPVLTSSQVIDRAQIAAAANQRVNRLYRRDLNNFGPRLGLAWDPTSQGKTSVRFSFGILYDEVNTFPLYEAYYNPPSLLSFSAGPQFGIPITYGLGTAGTRNFPVNPNLRAPRLTSRGGFEGARPNLGGIVDDFVSPQVWYLLAGVQQQVLGDTMVQVNYKYRRATREPYSITNINRFQGDLLDGLLNRLNPDFGSIRLLTNRGERLYHGLVTNLTKRFSQGYSLSASYTYNHGTNNFGQVPAGFGDTYYANETDPLNPEIDSARDDFSHAFTLHGIWELPILRGNTGWAGRLLGGWQLNSIWTFQSGELFVPLSTAAFRQGGDFNADGIRSDRPDAPAQGLPASFSKSDWLNGPLKAAMFPLPDPASPRPGNLSRDTFRRPGFANIDVAAVKEFPLFLSGSERGRFQIRAEAFNMMNRLNISGVENRINNARFGFPTSAFQNRIIQFAVKFVY